MNENKRSYIFVSYKILFFSSDVFTIIFLLFFLFKGSCYLIKIDYFSSSNRGLICKNKRSHKFYEQMWKSYKSSVHFHNINQIIRIKLMV